VALKGEPFLIERPAEHGGNEAYVKVRSAISVFILERNIIFCINKITVLV
jgi:hypothetical protein